MTVRRLLQRAQPGSDSAVEGHIRRGEQLASIIQARFPSVQRPQQWRAKHVRWALSEGLADRAPGTRYHFWRTARVIGAALSRWEGWQRHLNGPWTHPTGAPGPGRHAGGRPPKLANRR